MINSIVDLFLPPLITPRPRFLSLVFPPGGTKYACESKVVTPSKVDPNCVPTSVVVEKPTGEFGVNLVAVPTDALAVEFLPVVTRYALCRFI